VGHIDAYDASVGPSEKEALNGFPLTRPRWITIWRLTAEAAGRWDTVLEEKGVEKSYVLSPKCWPSSSQSLPDPLHVKLGSKTWKPKANPAKSCNDLVIKKPRRKRAV